MAHCPSCGALVATEDIDTTLGLAHCGACGTITELGALVEGPTTAVATPTPVDREPPTPEPAPLVPQPIGSLSERLPDQWTLTSETPLMLERGWFHSGAIGLMLFTAFWDGMMLLFVFGSGPGVICMPHAWIGLALGYYCVAMIVNRTFVSIEQGELVVRHGPLPWGGTQRRSTRDIEQLYVERSNIRVNKQPRWNLAVLDRMGRKRTLMSLMASPHEARALERLLEDALGIVDRPVEGEEPK